MRSVELTYASGPPLQVSQVDGGFVLLAEPSRGPIEVIVFGVTFISIPIATVTSYFVAANQEDFAADVAEAAEQDKADDVETHRLLNELFERVPVIEAELDDRGD